MISELADLLNDPIHLLNSAGNELRNAVGSWALPDWLPGVLLATVTGLMFLIPAIRRVGTTRGARLITITPPSDPDPAGATLFIARLSGELRRWPTRFVFGQPHLCWEYHGAAGQSPTIRVWVPGTYPTGHLEAEIRAAWPGTTTTTNPAHPPFPPERHHTRLQAGRLRLHDRSGLPINTDTRKTELLTQLFAVLDNLEPDVHAMLQIAIRPVTHHHAHRVYRRRTHNATSGRGGGTGGWADALAAVDDRASPAGGWSGRYSGDASSRIGWHQDTDTTRAIAATRRGPQYQVSIRYAAWTDHTTTRPATNKRRVLRATAGAVAGALTGAYAGRNYLRRGRLLLAPDILTRRHGPSTTTADLMSQDEVAALCHLPTEDTVPGLARVGDSPPEPTTPVDDAITGAAGSEPTTETAVKPLGHAVGGTHQPVELTVADARHHAHILGATGTGKSELLARMALTDITAGRGTTVIDPKGDLVADLLARLPEELGEQIVLLDPTQAAQPVLNPLDISNATADADRVTDDLCSTFARIYASSWGPRTDDILRASLLTLLRHAPGTVTLHDLPRLLTDDTYRERLTAAINDQTLKGFWRWYTDQSAVARAYATAPLQNKLRAVLLRPFAAHALAGGPSTLNLADVLDGRKHLLVRATADQIGGDTAALIASLVLARVWQTTRARSAQPQHERADASLYIDEAHYALNLPYGMDTMLAEARALRLSITLAHQYLRQLPPDLYAGISVNARTKVFFTAGGDDAKRLAPHVGERLGTQLPNLPAFQPVVRLVHHGSPIPAFRICTEKPPNPIAGRIGTIRHAAATNNAPPPRVRSARTDNPAQPVADPRRGPQPTSRNEPTDATEVGEAG